MGDEGQGISQETADAVSRKLQEFYDSLEPAEQAVLGGLISQTWAGEEVGGHQLGSTGLLELKVDLGSPLAQKVSGGAGKVNMQDFHFVMKVNKASPGL